MKVRRNPNHKAPSGSLRAPRKAEWRLPSRAVAPPVSYQVDTLAFGVKHTPEMGCYALQTLGSVPVIFIGNTASGDAHSEAAMTRDGSCLRGSPYCATLGSGDLSSGLPDASELTTCRVPEEDRSSPGTVGNRAPSHRVTYTFGDKHHQKDGYALQEIFAIILNHL